MEAGSLWQLLQRHVKLMMLMLVLELELELHLLMLLLLLLLPLHELEHQPSMSSHLCLFVSHEPCCTCLLQPGGLKLLFVFDGRVRQSPFVYNLVVALNQQHPTTDKALPQTTLAADSYRS